MSVLSFRRLPVAEVVTSHGKITIEPLNGKETLIQLLSRSGIPWSAVSVFSFDGELPGKSLASLDTCFGELGNATHVQIHFNRNVNPRLFDVLEYTRAPAEDGVEVSSFIFQQVDNGSGSVKNILKGLSQNECQEIICRNVHDFAREYLEPHGEVVVGVSGGGDSNALLLGLTTFSEFEYKIRPVILKGVADWDAGVPRAQELCKQYGLQLEVIEEAEVRRLCGLRLGGDLIQQYETTFPGDDFEFLGTFMIRKVLTALAEKNGSTVVTGLNLEDVLSESLFRVVQGKLPLPFPVRNIQETRFAYPLWMCPKKIIDGCFPKFSIENYDMRYPCFSAGRNLYYMMAYSLQSQFPAVVEQLLRGLKILSGIESPTFVLDEEIGTVTEEPIAQELREKFKKLLQSH